ncbi:MAG TPA: PEGA domain-containing protein, partial [Anaeromyxobacteraceae bacterium]|nr:PEGA domain-containing protein [Anaeromyxobacteraceae bacterium]
MNLFRSLAAAAFLVTGPASAAETLAVIGAGEPPHGPDADLAELTHQLRAACRDRAGNVLDVPTMRAKLLGQLSNATLAELDRAYGGALAVYQNGEFDSSIRTLRAIVDDLEGLPESEDGYVQWRRALLRLAHAATTVGRDAEADAALEKILRVEPGYRPDPEQYSPAYRRHFDELRAKVKAIPTRKLLVTSEGKPGTVFVNGRPMGTTPLTLKLPAGQYRVGGAAGSLHVPSFAVDLQEDDRAVVLDFALAESLRVNAGPGLALAGPARAYGIIR